MSILFRHHTPTHVELEQFLGATQCRSNLSLPSVSSASSCDCLEAQRFIKSVVKDRSRSGYQERNASAVLLPVRTGIYVDLADTLLLQTYLPGRWLSPASPKSAAGICLHARRFAEPYGPSPFSNDGSCVTCVDFLAIEFVISCGRRRRLSRDQERWACGPV